MDTYVFGAAFFYAMMVLFTVYMFLFAAPSTYKNCHYPILSYSFMMVNVAMVVLFYKLSMQGRRRKQMRSLLSLLLQLTDDVSMIVLFILIIREKCLWSVCLQRGFNERDFTSPGQVSELCVASGDLLSFWDRTLFTLLFRLNRGIPKQIMKPAKIHIATNNSLKQTLLRFT